MELNRTPSCDLRPVVLGQVEALADRSLTPNTQPKLPHFQLTQQKEELFELVLGALEALRDGGVASSDASGSGAMLSPQLAPLDMPPRADAAGSSAPQEEDEVRRGEDAVTSSSAPPPAGSGRKRRRASVEEVLTEMDPKAAEHGLDEKALSQVPENLHAQASTSKEKNILLNLIF